MLFKQCITVLLLFNGMLVFSQSTKVTPSAPAAITGAAPATTPAYNFTKINAFLSYAYVINSPTKIHPQEGDQVMLHLQSICNNRIMYSSWQANKGKPVSFGVTKPLFKGDILEAIVLMTPGDSIMCLGDAEVLFKNSKTKMPDFVKPGDKMQYFIRLVSIKSKEQVQKEQQAAFEKAYKLQQAKQKAAEAKQIAKDDKILKAYFVKKGITPKKTASGLYYTIKEEGAGIVPVANDTLIVNYTGTLLDGTKFDSNEDTAFKHATPYNFVLGRKAVINGWEEGFALLKTGSTATFYIPSTLAYGAQTRPGSPANPKGIPANSVLIFDVKLLNTKQPYKPETEAEVMPASPYQKDTIKSEKRDSLNVPQPLKLNNKLK
jgi:FKBP-type peptidyl-prolyl cis-trans isomerase FkpA